MISLPVDERAVYGRLKAWHQLPVQADVCIDVRACQIHGLSLPPSPSLPPDGPSSLPPDGPSSLPHPPPPVCERVARLEVAWQVLEAV